MKKLETVEQVTTKTVRLTEHDIRELLGVPAQAEVYIQAPYGVEFYGRTPLSALDGEAVFVRWEEKETNREYRY